MQYLREARFPFLKECSRIAENNDVGIDRLTSSSEYEKARKRGVERVLDAIRNSEVSYVPLTGSDYDRLMEIVSYPYARMLVSAVNDRFLTRRYALAEAVRMNRLLGEESRETVAAVSKELGVSTTNAGGELRMHFTDFIRFSVRIKSPEWKLVNTEIHKGFVTLPKERFYRVLQNALQDRLEEELPLDIPNELKDLLKRDVEHIRVVLAEMKSKYSPATGGDIKIELFPPCMRFMLAGAQNGVNLPHSGRFALVSFLHNLGMDSERILNLFSQSPDFDASKSSYQIRHITGELGGAEYTPPECSTMKSYGICFEPDALCNSGKMKHPLSYYRIKTLPPQEKKLSGGSEQNETKL